MGPPRGAWFSIECDALPPLSRGGTRIALCWARRRGEGGELSEKDTPSSRVQVEPSPVRSHTSPGPLREQTSPSRGGDPRRVLQPVGRSRRGIPRLRVRAVARGRYSRAY